MQQDSWSGKHLREMFRTGTQLLGGNAAAVNALNVFPVPDGDTGTNMLLTMQSALIEANQCPDNDASGVANAMARGALMGARGNSGVILSQILRGIAEGLNGKQSFTAADIANALLRASVTACKAVSNPEEGTILTVIREASAAAKQACTDDACELHAIIEALVDEARDSVNRTPALLPILRECGVVDAGGQGLCIIFEGMLSHLQGRELPQDMAGELQPASAAAQLPEQDTEYGYCTEFLIKGKDMDLDEMRTTLHSMGEHVLVVGDASTARIHIHTSHPGAVLSYGTLLGTLHKIKIDNMQEQHQEFLADRRESYAAPAGSISTIAVATGDGLIEVFRSLGATHVVHGGETMNPSVQELIEAVKTVPTEEVIILPNNPDILPTANQVREISTKRVVVVPSRTVTQGISALVAFNYEAELEANEEVMTEAMSGVRTGHIATAMRTMHYKNLWVREGQVIGFVDDELVVAEYAMENAIARILERMSVEDSEILTAYYGNGVDWAEAERLFGPVRARYPHLEVEVIFGGQPHYQFLISVE